MREYLNETPSNRWNGRLGVWDLACLSRAPRSSNLTPCDFFPWDFVKDSVYEQPITQNLEEVKNRIRTAIATVTKYVLARVWEEFEYRCDIVRVART